METKQEDREPKPRFGTKADFIRSQPNAMSAAEVVALAAAQGLQLSTNHVYNLRNAARRKRAISLALKGPAAGSRDDDQRRTGAVIASAEWQLRHAIAEVGLRRAREVLDSMASAFRGE